ncbi:G-box-binding factor 4-like isoform X2 [Phalaenopsis equestris]|uniref:G-box-binding factor 4-like isoform X1 n=1 Tax=Phalaenopsis equestris TaxID=78828 RepID=UPI0009E5BEDA|nr:G-box-binding factor 4-like isoform X1 [Phalaenopsis equestris]XP_020587878.1 G-box-binding factor 4-like isoform X2 [Phalaenopsis equestris]
MAWPQFMSSSFPSSANADHTLKPSIYFLNAATEPPANNGFRLAGMEDHLLRKLYEGEVTGPCTEVSRGAKGSSRDGSGFREVTLEDYLTKARVVSADDLNTAAAAVVSERIGQDDLEETGNDQMAGMGDGAAAGGGERGKGRKRVAVDSADKAALQRQKRMIKNRESAARSRERKQQYTNQLEQTVFKLEEENAILLKEREKHLKWRFKKLVENVIPVAEMKPGRALRRTSSFP